MGSPKNCRIRFVEDAKEERVREGVAGKPDENYTVVHRKGEEMDCTQATLIHWLSRGKAVEVEQRPAAIAPEAPVPAMTLPPV